MPLVVFGKKYHISLKMTTELPDICKCLSKSFYVLKDTVSAYAIREHMSTLHALFYSANVDRPVKKVVHSYNA